MTSPLKGLRVQSMYQKADVYIDGKYQTFFTFTPTRGPDAAAKEVMSITPSGGIIKVKQGRYVWTYKVRRDSSSVTLEQIHLSAKERERLKASKTQ